MVTRALVPIALCARIVAAQTTVSGIVRDSLLHRPLAGAIVQLASADGELRSARAATADSLGRFSFPDVASGRYLVGFIHPILDSLGIEPLVNEIRVTARPVRVNLATPAPARLRTAACGAGRDTAAAVIGIVRDARGEPVSGAAVVAEWLELSISSAGFDRRIARATASSKQNGWFSLCNVPSTGTIFASAAHGDTTTDAIALAIPDDRLIHRDLFLDGGRHAHLHGVVTDARGEPLSGARISIPNGPETRADARGEWTLADAPGGTRMIELRAIGYYPQRVAVDAVEGAPDVRVAMPTMKSMLDTVRISAARLRGVSGFEERRRSTTGRFFTAQDIRTRTVVTISDMFRNVPGVYLDRRDSIQLTMRGMGGGRCAPRIFVDGSYMAELDAESIDGLIRPEDISGIEVYMQGQVPAQFIDGSFGFDVTGAPKEPCGAIVIWTLP